MEWIPHPLAFRVPMRLSDSVGAAGHPILWEGDHGVCPANFSGVKRLWKPSKKDPIEI